MVKFYQTEKKKKEKENQLLIIIMTVIIFLYNFLYFRYFNLCLQKE